MSFGVNLSLGRSYASISSAVIPKYSAPVVAKYSEICAVFIAPYAILAKIQNDHGSQSAKTITGLFQASDIRLIILRVDLAG